MSDWEVFARSELDAPIRHVGTVAADRPEDAEVFAWKLYDEWSWKEMFVVRREDIVRLIPGDHPEQTSATACLIFGRRARGSPAVPGSPGIRRGRGSLGRPLG